MRLARKVLRFSAAFSIVLSLAQAVEAQPLMASPTTLNFSGLGDSPVPPAPQTIQLTSTGANVPFMLLGQPNYATVSPVSGTTPATITITPGTSYPGTYQSKFEFAVGPPLVTYVGDPIVTINLNYAFPPPPVITSVVNAATLQPGPLSPGEIVTIFGTNLGAAKDMTSIILVPVGSKNYYFWTFSGDTRVVFNGLPNSTTFAPILYADNSQVNAIIPLELAGQPNIVLQVQSSGLSQIVTLPSAATTPAIFSANGSGSGPGAILDAASFLNSAANPTPKGEAVQIFGEGSGLWTGLRYGDGLIDTFGPPYAVPVAPVSVTIGGQPAQVIYAGQAPDLVTGVLQVNAIIPLNIGSGPQPVVLTVGGNSNASQQITVNVK